MLQSLVLGQPCVLIIDHAKLERKALALVTPLSGNTSLRYLPDRPSPKELTPLNQCFDPDEFTRLLEQTNVLINVAEFTQIFSLRCLFQLVHSLKTCTKVKQLWLWASPATIGIDMVVPYLDHMAPAVVDLRDSVNMCVSVKFKGRITKKLYSYTIKDHTFDLVEVKKEAKVKETEPAVNPESLTTFKINFDEEELQARNTLKLPYERTSDEIPAESKIIYHPDADDDFDEEDPDDDLNI